MMRKCLSKLILRSLASAWILLAWVEVRARDNYVLDTAQYRRYQQRLHDYFVYIGAEPGSSIPAAQIQVEGTRGTEWIQSDGTIYLGFYLATLATEYKRHQLEGQATTATVRELYYALNAVWRLDIRSNYYRYDQCIHCGGTFPITDSTVACDSNLPTCQLPACYVCDSCPDNPNLKAEAGAPTGPMDARTYNDPRLDGFLMRSDGDCAFISILESYNPSFFSGVQVSSDLLTPNSNDGRNKEMSQDQASFLLMGLFAVVRCLEDSLNYNGVPLREFARNEALLMVQQLRGRGFWILKNPRTQRRVQRGAFSPFYPFAKPKAGQAVYGDSVYLANVVSFLTAWLWNTQQFPLLTGARINAAMDGAFAATGDSWSLLFFNTTRWGLQRYATHRKLKMEIYLLLYAVLHEDVRPLSRAFYDRYVAMLEKAYPNGPESPWPNGSSTHFGWNKPNRFIASRFDRENITVAAPDTVASLDGIPLVIESGCRVATERPDRRALAAKCVREKNGSCKFKLFVDEFYLGGINTQGQWYNGIDFMLLFNLFAIAEHQSVFEEAAQ